MFTASEAVAVLPGEPVAPLIAALVGSELLVEVANLAVVAARRGRTGRHRCEDEPHNDCRDRGLRVHCEALSKSKYYFDGVFVRCK